LANRALSFCSIMLLILGALFASGRPALAVGIVVPEPISTPNAQPQSALPAPASPSLSFDCFSLRDGLSNSQVTSILQDRRGFLWIGTIYGLNRYDGYNYQTFTFDSGEDPLYDNHILKLFEDRLGNLWIITYSDLVRRDSDTGEFFHYRLLPEESRSSCEDLINSIADDQQGSLWVGTVEGLFRFEPSTDSFTRFAQSQYVTSLYFDRQGGLWLGTPYGLSYNELGLPFARKTAIYRNEAYNPESLSANEIYTIYEDRQGFLWLNPYAKGLNRLDPATGKVTRFLNDPSDPYSLSSNLITTILEDSLGRLWVGTDAGLNLLDRSMGHFIRYRYSENDPHSLNHDTVNSLFQERSGVLWIGTAGGICKLNETASRFNHYQKGTDQLAPAAEAQPKVLSVLSDNHITAIDQDRNGILWVGTFSGGLNKLDRNTGMVMVYRHDPADPTSLPEGEVTAIYEDRSGALWVGASSGLARFDAESGTFNNNAFQDYIVRDITEDQQGNLWVGGEAGIWIKELVPSFHSGQALNVVKEPVLNVVKETGEPGFTMLPAGENLLNPQDIQEVFADRSGAIWVSTLHDGLYRLDPSADNEETPWQVTRFPHESANPHSPGESLVLSFYEDSKNILWMGSMGNGLVRYDRETGTFSHYLPSAGYSPYVSCIQEDANGFLWMGTHLGLARFDPRSKAFTYFDSRDGLEIGSETAECFRSESGELFFGGMEGLVSFTQGGTHPNPFPPAVVISNLSLNNKLLRSDLAPDEQLELSYKDNNLSFDFVALDFTSPAKNQYAYEMEGLDSGWVEAGARRHADYPDLKPGAYTFRVKASNNSGIWNEQGAAVHITITPPIWQTWWFLGTLGLVVVGAVLGGVWLRLKGLETHKRDLEKQVQERTHALEQKAQELEALLAENTRLSQQSQELAVLEERNRLARDLHDSITQSLYGITLNAEIAARLLGSGEINKTGLSLQELKALALDALGEMRLMIYELRPSVFEQEGLVAALQARLDAVEGRVGLQTSLVLQGEISLSPQVEAGLYRIAQEALNNVLKHAHASHVTITLAQDEQSIAMEITDDGVGFDPLLARDAGGMGLRNMQDRARELGFDFEVLSRPGKGTKISLRIPLP
jgi:signal transduction histidine kinase/ligand-binding sensor domain-containing protein